MANKNLLADYFKEADGYELYEQPNEGFMLYRIIGGDEFHVAHFYTDPSVRHTGVGLGIGRAVEKIARNAGCKYMSCIVTTAKGKEEQQTKILYYYIKFGFKVALTTAQHIILAKELN